MQAAVGLPTEAAAAAPRPGRPRDDSRDDAIRAAVLELLGEVGYADLTMDAVAARARAGKATIYRRWPNKADMVLDSVRCAATDHALAPDTGSLRGDLHALLSGFCDMLTSPLGSTALALMGELPRNPDLAQAFRTGFLTDKLAASEAMVARAVARGEARPDVDAALVTQIGPGLFLHRALVTGQRVDAALVDQVVDEILLPLLSP